MHDPCWIHGIFQAFFKILVQKIMSCHFYGLHRQGFAKYMGRFGDQPVKTVGPGTAGID